MKNVRFEKNNQCFMLISVFHVEFQQLQYLRIRQRHINFQIPKLDWIKRTQALNGTV
jgi:hypothetical protein